jgi:hypothetical protein
MRRKCEVCGKGVNENSCSSRVTLGDKIWHFSCWRKEEQKKRLEAKTQ